MRRSDASPHTLRVTEGSWRAWNGLLKIPVVVGEVWVDSMGATNFRGSCYSSGFVSCRVGLVILRGLMRFLIIVDKGIAFC